MAAGGSGLEAVKIWDVESQEELLTLPAQGSMHHRTAFSRDGHVLGSMNDTRQLHLWRAPSWEEIEAAESGSDSNREGK